MDGRRTWTAAMALGALAVGLVASSCSAASDASSFVDEEEITETVNTEEPPEQEPNLGCNPACESPQFCSVAQVCIDPGTCADELDCEAGLTCSADGECVPGGNCGAQEVSIDPVQPNLLIVLDRSCSMKPQVNGVPKWTIAVQAIEKLTTDYQGQIRFGLALFPDTVGANCTQGPIDIPVGDGNEGAIQALLTASLQTSDPNYPDGPCVTNIDTAMEQAAGEPALDDPDRPSYVLLLTDGAQYGCSAAGGDAGTTAIITELCQQRDVHTFVLGFGGGVDANQLNIFAEAGCVPTGDPQTEYYKAEDQQSLDTALGTIANATLSCTVDLQDEPESADDIFVFFNNDTTPIARDDTHSQGWDYDPATNQVTFYGADCDLLKDGQVTDIDIVLGCSSPTPD